MAKYNLTTQADNLTGTADADTFSGADGGIDNLNGAGGNDFFEFGSNQTGAIDGGADTDTVFTEFGYFDQKLTFANVEKLELSGGSNLYATAAQFSAFSTISVADKFSDFYFEVQGNGGTVDFSTRYVSAANFHVDASLSDAAVQLTGTAKDDEINGSEFNDTLNGGNGLDTIYGGSGRDILNGGSGTDLLRGGTEDDIYFVDDVNDVVDESYYGGGIELVRSGNVSINLSDAMHFLGDVENALLDGSASLDLTGNGLANALTGNSGINHLTGGGGNDTLNGKAGADVMIGGADDDTYIVDNAGDQVIEAVGGGANDRIVASVSYTIAAGQEIERIEATTAASTFTFNLTGNEFGQKLFGNNSGSTLNGGAGNDTLTGYLGNDSFYFNTALNAATNVDHITDFHNIAGDNDQILINNSIFTKVGADGALVAGAFQVNTTGLATEADDRIIYDRTTGKLFYDADGNKAGGVAGVLFAVIDDHASLSGSTALSAADFLVV